MARYMKKWWLERNIDERVRWSGWVNTVHEVDDPSEIPQKISGKYWGEHDEKGFHGLFTLTPGSELAEAVQMEPDEDHYVVSSGFHLRNPLQAGPNGVQSTAETDAILRSLEPLDEVFPRFEGLLEEDWVPEHTYVMKL